MTLSSRRKTRPQERDRVGGIEEEEEKPYLCERKGEGMKVKH